MRPEHLGIQLGSGGKERVIGLRAAILSPDWTERCEREENERRGEQGSSSSQSASVPADSAGAAHIEDGDVTVHQRNTACFCGIFFFFCQPDNGREEAGSDFDHAFHLGCGASLCDYSGVHSGR